MYALSSVSFFADLTSDRTMKNLLNTVPLDEFWLKIKKQYPELSRKALLKLTPFTTTYLCESAFSTLSFVKNKYRNRLDSEHTMILALTNFQPRIDELTKSVFTQSRKFK